MIYRVCEQWRVNHSDLSTPAACMRMYAVAVCIKWGMAV